MQLWDVDNFKKNGAGSGKISTKEILCQKVWFANIYSSPLKYNLPGGKRRETLLY